MSESVVGESDERESGVEASSGGSDDDEKGKREENVVELRKKKSGEASCSEKEKSPVEWKESEPGREIAAAGSVFGLRGVRSEANGQGKGRLGKQKQQRLCVCERVEKANGSGKARSVRGSSRQTLLCDCHLIVQHRHCALGSPRWRSRRSS